MYLHTLSPSIISRWLIEDYRVLKKLKNHFLKLQLLFLKLYNEKKIKVAIKTMCEVLDSAWKNVMENNIQKCFNS